MITHPCKVGGWKCGRHRDEARWSGGLTQHCTVCGELFIGGRAADMHVTYDEAGEVVCHDPATRTRRNGAPMFEKVPKPSWDPPYVWREFRPDLPEHPAARERDSLIAARAVRGTRITPDAQKPSDSGADTSVEVA